MNSQMLGAVTHVANGSIQSFTDTENAASALMDAAGRIAHQLNPELDAFEAGLGVTLHGICHMQVQPNLILTAAIATRDDLFST